MQPLYTEQEFKAAKSRQLLPLKCLHCNKTFHKPKNKIQASFTQKDYDASYCSQKCHKIHKCHYTSTFCHQCNQPISKRPCDLKYTKHNFCSQSCAARYSNAHKTKGTRISKLEIWLSSKLPTLYPNLEFHFNRKDAINGELDIYIPSLRLAFELNGIFHYEPIYGPEKLASTQTNDHRKMLACAEHNIELCVIDVSHQKYFKEQSSIKFLTVITDIINTKLSRS